MPLGYPEKGVAIALNVWLREKQASLSRLHFLSTLNRPVLGQTVSSWTKVEWALSDQNFEFPHHWSQIISPTSDQLILKYYYITVYLL